MWIDYYDALGVGLDCSTEDVKNAFKKLVLKNHPDKAASLAKARGCEAPTQDELSERMRYLQEAREVLEDEERRKRYNTFGIDIGKENTESEVIQIGFTMVVLPVALFLLVTVVCRFALWLLAYSWIVYLLLFCGLVGVILFFSVFKRSLEDNAQFLLPLWVINAFCIVQWIVAGVILDALCILILSSQVTGSAFWFLESGWKVGCIALGVSLFVAWLVQGWWLYIIGFETVLVICLSIAALVAGCIVRLWIDQLQATQGQKVKEWRENMRSQRDRWVKEVEDLKKQVEKLSR